MQIELAQLTQDEHGWNQDFESLLRLAEEHHICEASDTTVFFPATLLTLIGRLGDLIVYVKLSFHVFARAYSTT